MAEIESLPYENWNIALRGVYIQRPSAETEANGEKGGGGAGRLQRDGKGAAQRPNET